MKSVDIGKSQTMNIEGLINRETLPRFCNDQMTALRKTKTNSKSQCTKKGSLQIPVVGSPQTTAVALMGASTQRPDVPQTTQVDITP